MEITPTHAQSAKQDFCQWCYDRGLRYPANGKPWAHALDCPSRKGVDNTPHPVSCVCGECAVRRLTQKLDAAIDVLKLAYAEGHYCDNYAEGKRCPGCEAGITLEKITGRKWTQEECEHALAGQPPQDRAD